MAKSGNIIIRLVSTENTGYFYITRKNPKMQGKLEKMKYDPKIRKKVLFKEAKK